MNEKRFQIILISNMPEEFQHEVYDDEYVHCLCEVVDGKIIRVVGTDGGEPEDQSFVRDWEWVVREMNALCEEKP